LKDTSEQHTWAFLDDGKMDEVESRGALHIAAKEHLDNLTFVINCNLQRLDGPVRGNGKIIQELESPFRRTSSNVINELWGADGDYQTYRAENGAFIRDNFFGRDPRTKALVEDMSDEDIWWKLNRGGHDAKKIYAAFEQATKRNGKPTVILAHTVKGYRLGKNFAGRNATHQMKKFTIEDLKALRDTLRIPITDEQLDSGSVYDAPFYLPDDDAPVMKYLKEHRAALGGPVPSRSTEHKPLQLPGDKAYEVV